MFYGKLETDTRKRKKITTKIFPNISKFIWILHRKRPVSEFDFTFGTYSYWLLESTFDFQIPPKFSTSFPRNQLLHQKLSLFKAFLTSLESQTTFLINCWEECNWYDGRVRRSRSCARIAYLHRQMEMRVFFQYRIRHIYPERIGGSNQLFPFSSTGFRTKPSRGKLEAKARKKVWMEKIGGGWSSGRQISRVSNFYHFSPPANNSDLIEIPPHIWGNSILKTSPSFERYARAQDLLDLVSLSSIVILFNESAKLAEILLVILSSNVASSVTTS